MAVSKKAGRTIPASEIVLSDTEPGVLEDTELAPEYDVPAELDYLDPDVGSSYTLKISEQFTFAGRNHMVIFEGAATLREDEHFALMAQRLADMVLYGVSVSKDMFIAQKRIEKEGGEA
jgi:hypothetical protein